MIIHIIGDSHTGAFTHSDSEINIPPFKQHYIAGATAYNLCKERSISNSRDLLNKALSQVNKSEDIVLLWFGEIDCRLHIYQKSDKTEESIRKGIEETVKRYGLMLDELNGNFNFAVMSVPPCNIENNAVDRNSKKLIYNHFNLCLKKFCDEKKYKYIDTFTEFADADGFILSYFSRGTECNWFKTNNKVWNDPVHLNNRIIPHIIDQINNLFGTNLYLGVIA